MTDELTKTFFDTFGIEPREQEVFVLKRMIVKEYPQITDRILLKLICIANQYEDYLSTTNMKNIQARTLRILLRTEKFYKNYYGKDKGYKKLVKQVRTLFEEG